MCDYSSKDEMDFNTNGQEEARILALTEARINITQLLHSTHNFDELMNNTILLASKAIECETAAISLRKGDEWIISYVYGFPESIIGSHMSDKEELHAVLAIESKKIVVINDAFKDNRVNYEHMVKWDIRSVLVLPLIADEQVVGVCFFNYHKNIKKFNKFDIIFCENIATSISLALHNTLLINKLNSELSERKKLEEELQINKERLSMALKAGYSGCFDWDLKDNIVTWSDDLFDLYGLKLHEFNGSERIKYIIPDDWELEQAAIESSFKTGIYENEFRIRRKDNGEIRWIYGRGKVLKDQNGIATRMIGINMDITDRKQISLMKEEFFSFISHELKTPITVINSAIQAMEFICKDELTNRIRNFLNKIKQNTFRQLRLVNNFLDMNRVSAGYSKLNKKNIDIIYITKAIIESISLYAQQKNIQVTFTSNVHYKIIGMDEEKYERILLNLLSNAIKFTPNGKWIRVKLTSKKDWISLEVRDNGIGIPKDKQALIFERFGQVNSFLSRHSEGSGIGLSFTKLIIELLGGSISVISDEGKGSTFIVKFPSVKVPDSQIAKAAVDKYDNRLTQSIAIEFSDIYLK